MARHSATRVVDTPGRMESDHLRVRQIADEAGARLVDEISLGKALLRRYTAPGGSQVLVVFTDDGCEHFVQGGAKWVDLAMDMQDGGQSRRVVTDAAS